MQAALEEAQAAAARGEVPVGAVVVAADGAILARAGNRTEAACDPVTPPASAPARDCRIATCT
jgi:tRNA(Arg) A34 adenosine deaminase TadA